MIICCYADISERWSDKEFAVKLNLLPKQLREKVLNKKLWQDKQLSVAGKLLLLQLLRNFDLNTISLKELKYTPFGRPYFQAGIDFNITHSGNRVICCGTLSGAIGIDLELIKEINLEDYADYFTQNEWRHIKNAEDQTAGFYHYWTRKEAVIKAIGNGFDTLLSSIDVSGDSLVYNGFTWYLTPLLIDDNYKCTIAVTANKQDIQIMRIVV